MIRSARIFVTDDRGPSGRVSALRVSDSITHLLPTGGLYGRSAVSAAKLQAEPCESSAATRTAKLIS
jgi:hypothetical protein